MTNTRHAIIPASYLILQKENKILLLRRFNTGYEDGKYTLIAGHVEKNERCDDLSWFEIDKLPTNIVPYIKQAIELGLGKKIFYSEVGWSN